MQHLTQRQDARTVYVTIFYELSLSKNYAHVTGKKWHYAWYVMFCVRGLPSFLLGPAQFIKNGTCSFFSLCAHSLLVELEFPDQNSEEKQRKRKVKEFPCHFTIPWGFHYEVNGNLVLSDNRTIPFKFWTPDVVYDENDNNQHLQRQKHTVPEILFEISSEDNLKSSVADYFFDENRYHFRLNWENMEIESFSKENEKFSDISSKFDPKKLSVEIFHEGSVVASYNGKLHTNFSSFFPEKVTQHFHEGHLLGNLIGISHYFFFDIFQVLLSDRTIFTNAFVGKPNMQFDLKNPEDSIAKKIEDLRKISSVDSKIIVLELKAILCNFYKIAQWKYENNASIKSEEISNYFSEEILESKEISSVKENLTKSFLMLESTSQNNWKRQRNRIEQLKKEKKAIYNPEQFYLRLVFLRIPLPAEIESHILRFCPPIFYGGTLFFGETLRRTSSKHVLSLNFQEKTFSWKIEKNDCYNVVFVEHFGKFSLEDVTVKFYRKKSRGVISNKDYWDKEIPCHPLTNSSNYLTFSFPDGKISEDRYSGGIQIQFSRQVDMTEISSDEGHKISECFAPNFEAIQEVPLSKVHKLEEEEDQ
jgi:hypothetical protein